MRFYRIRDKISTKQQLAALMSSMKLAVIFLDTENKVVNMNKQAARLFSIKKKIRKIKLLELVFDSELNTALTKLLHSKANKSFFSLPFGEKLYSLNFSNYPVFNSKDIKIGSVVLVKKASKEKKFSKLREDFVANVSHELKTPLTVIQGAVETLENGALEEEEEAKHFVKIIKKHSNRLSALISDILSLSSVEENLKANNVTFTKFKLSEMLENISIMFEDKILKSHVDFIVETPPNIALTGNKVLLEQALANLVDNAIKYSDKKNKITIYAEQRDDKILISVKDRGIGLKNSDISRIFERFFRVDKIKSKNLGGTGLGLSIVKQIIMIHKGNITVKSELGVGSTFTIILPDDL
ncbi:MAG TPA: HAMP domain-containing sensor histidine kinase [Victivallales bacterium]|nr:HAMP domain-containing sensor histidine kinase [Victivallales bacterium]